jgi:hypothetical protein
VCEKLIARKFNDPSRGVVLRSVSGAGLSIYRSLRRAECPVISKKSKVKKMEVILVEVNTQGTFAGTVKYYDLSVTDSSGALRTICAAGSLLFEVNPPALLPDTSIQRIADDLAHGVIQGNVREFDWQRQQAQ